MRIVSIEESPFHQLPYRNVAGDRRIVRATLPFLRAKVDALPNGLSAIVAAADLQGREFPTNESANGRLLGEHLAEHCALLAETGMLPALDGVGVILAGDLYTRELLDIRGHAHWEAPLASLQNGTQVLNVDSRVVLLVRD